MSRCKGIFLLLPSFCHITPHFWYECICIHNTCRNCRQRQTCFNLKITIIAHPAIECCLSPGSFIASSSTPIQWIVSKPAKSHGISVSLQKSCVISRSHGNVTKSHGIWLIFYFSAKKSCFWCESERFLMRIRDADHRDLKLASGGARTRIASELRLHK